MKMARKAQRTKYYIIGFALLIVMTAVSTYAWSADTSLTTDPTRVYVTSNPGTTTTITGYSSRPVGKNSIVITFTSNNAAATLNLQFLDSSGNIINPTAATSVVLDSTTLTKNSDYSYTASSVATGSHTLTVSGTGVWQDLDSGTGGNQTFGGLMVVVS